jgi:DHA2 family multidrug resistance protein
VPIGIIGIAMATMYLREIRSDVRPTFDLPGFLFSATGLATLLYGLSDASTDGWGSTKVISFITIGVVLLVLFVIIELNVARNGGKPLMNLAIFQNLPFSTSMFASTLVTISLYGGLFLIPIYLQSLRGLSAYQAGLVLLPQSIASMVAVLLGGRLVDRFGVRAIVIPGLILMAISNVMLSSLTVDLPFSVFQIALVVRGFSTGLAMQPLMVSALAEIEPHQLSQASSLSTVLRFVASSFGVGVLATMVQSQTKVHYVHLAEQVTAGTPVAKFLFQLQAYFVSQGGSLQAAKTAAIQTIHGLLMRQASVLAMQDTFKVVLVLCVVAVVASFFVRGSKAAPPHNDGETEIDLEAQAAREEALLGV